jgi:hypothetical protein
MRSVTLLVLLAACGRATPAEEHGWLVGRRQTSAPDGLTILEGWIALPDGGLLGASSLRGQLPDGRSALLWAETLAIVDGPRGRTLVAWPFGKPAMTFQLVESAPDRLVFEDPGRAFPSRLTYTRTGQDTLEVAAIGTRDGAPHVERWTLQTALDEP